MSQENVDAIRAVYEHLNRTGEVNPEAVGAEPIFDGSRVPGFALYRSLDSFYADWLPYRDTFDDWWIEVEELRDGRGDCVFAAVRDGGRLKETGSEVRQPVFHVWEVRAGKIVGWIAFLDRSEALEAAGLHE
jgi:hypothetical protein